MVMKTCEVCQETQAKYRCPGCGTQTCCLQCVRQHKATLGCTGQRNKTTYVKVKDFSDINLLSDYRFLEDAGRKNNNASRDAIKRRHFKPGFVKELERQAVQRGINLRIMPYPMSRRKENYTTYQNRTRSILWQIQWKFDGLDLTHTDRRIPDTSTLRSVLEGLVGPDGDPVLKHRLRPFIQAGLQTWGLFLKVEPCRSSELRYHRLDVNKTITENLASKCVIEYPTIHVVLESGWGKYRTVEEKQSQGAIQGEEQCQENLNKSEKCSGHISQSETVLDGLNQSEASASGIVQSHLETNEINQPDLATIIEGQSETTKQEIQSPLAT